MTRFQKPTLLWLLVFLAALLQSTIGSAAAQQNKDVLSNDPNSPQKKIIEKWIEETFKNVKAVNVIVCLDVQGWTPDWFTSDALVQETIDYIHSGAHTITYAPGADQQPKRQGCGYGPYLDEPGNLNFITIGTVNTATPVRGHPFTTASLTRTIYRPDHRTSVSGFLRTPFLIGLSGRDARFVYERFFKDRWSIGASLNTDYDKP